jgi:hypothetical protein
MGEFSAHRLTISPGERVVIATQVNLYVSPFGDDVVNSGIEQGSPFRTPERAVQWLGDKYISDFGFVTINFAPGIYDIQSELIFDHDQGNRVAFVGAEPETLLLQYVSNYNTTSFTQNGYNKYYSASYHGITMSCVRPSDSTVFEQISSGQPIANRYSAIGTGVIIEDYDLSFKEDYNPAFYYASYPVQPRNNISKISTLLGCHKLTNINVGTGVLQVQSSIRDDWFSLPQGSSQDIARMYGNPFGGISYARGACANPSDTTEASTNNWLLPVTESNRGHYLNSIPVGYYGLAATTGITTGSTANLIGTTFPNGSTFGSTASYLTKDVSNISTISFYSATGPAGSFLNDAILFGNNYHEHRGASGGGGMGSSGAWGSVNSNRITVKLIPTVFRRFGNIMKVGGGGLRKIKNIFFDGIDMPSHYDILDKSYRSNKYAFRSVATRLGEKVINEPAGFGNGLFNNVGIKDFHVAVLIDGGSDAELGTVVASNCSFGVLSYDGSAVRTKGSVCTGMAAAGFGAIGSSTMAADRCFASFVGQSIAVFRMKTVGAGAAFNDNSFIPGQTYSTPDGKVRGTVWRWNAKDRDLAIALRLGLCESGDPFTQYN